MLKRLQQLFLLFISLGLAYLIVVRAVLTWAQTAPEYFLPFVEQITQTQIQIDRLNIEQTWLGFEFEVKNAQIRSESFQGQLNYASGDLNLWFFLGGDWHYGEKLMLDGVTVSMAGRKLDKDAKRSFNDLKIDQAWSILYKSWQLINLKNIQLSLPFEQHHFAFGIDSIQSYRGVKWTVGGILTLSVDNAKKSRIQLKGRFSPPAWRDPLDGNLSLNILTPILLDPFYRLMSEEWQSTLPTGALLGDVDLEVKRGELTKLAIQSHAQNLVWPVNDALLPKSFGIDLNWVATNQLIGKASENWQFQIENLRFDKAYVDTISPIFIRLDQNKLLTFKASEIDYEVIRPIAELFIKRFQDEQFAQSVQQLKLVDVSGSLDIVELNLVSLKLKIPKLTIEPYKNQPGFSVQELVVEKQHQNLWIKTSQSVLISAKAINQGAPFPLQLTNPVQITFDETNQNWQLVPLKFQLAQIPMALQASGHSDGNVQLDLQFEPNRLSTVKRYLPYSMMSTTLQNWLQQALIDGDGVKGALRVQGHVQDFPFENGEGIFEVTTEVHHATLKFQPDWPALTDFSAKLKFTPYQLQIVASDVLLHRESLRSAMPVKAKTVRVVLDDLASNDIAVNIQGQVITPIENALEYLQQTPLLTKIGIDSFLKEQLTATGEVKVDLDSIWVPVSGYDDKTESVKGRVALNQVDMILLGALPLTQVKGSLQFTESRIKGDAISATLFDQPASILVSTPRDEIKIAVNSALASNNQFVTGVAPWQAHVNIPLSSASPISIYNEIDLNPLTSNLPAPLSEEELIKQGRPKKLVSTITIQNDLLKHELQLDNLLQMQSAFDLDKSQLNFVSIDLNKQGQKQTTDIDKGGAVKGRLHFVDFDAWLKSLPELQTYGKDRWGLSLSEGAAIFWHNSHLKIDRLQVFGVNMNNLALDWSSLSKDGSLVVAVQGDEVKATIKNKTPNQFAVNLTRLSVDFPLTSAQSNAADSSCQVGPDLQKTVKTQVDFEGENIQINGKVIDNLSFKLAHADSFLKIDQLNVFANKVNTPFVGNYWFNKEDNTSRLSGSIKTKHVDAMLKFLGFNKGFKGNEMQMGVNLVWVGGVSCFALKQLSGDARFKMEDGVIKDAEPGFARLLGLLSFESLARRLRLNVNDFTEAGLVYDQIEGEGRFDQGYFKIDKLELKAPAAKAQVFGQVDLMTNVLDLKAEVTPSLGSSLPAIAAISGFATPIAGLAAYVFMKYMPFVNEDIITYRYDVTGTFTEPDLDVKGPSVELFRFNGNTSPTPS
ncbi:hypothetical protein CYQ88_02960, partial [Hydrogenovibrio sp. SC-1]|uniref:YhdP family phospholipid transporter n=1 Tax=Hydrogenovibrio sp. SC-1 TaxID=2065820 RepID=UPI000CC63318